MSKGRDIANLKRDPLLDQYEKTSSWMQHNARPLTNYLIAGGAILALLLIGWLIYSRRSNNAGEALAEAFRVDSAMVANPLPPNLPPGQYAYTTQEEKHRKAYEAFSKAANDYSGNRDIGRYYAATHQVYFEPEKAEQTFRELAQQNSPLGRQAALALAGRLETAGKFEEAIAEYKKLQAQPGDLPGSLLKLKIARALEAQGKKAEAANLYVEIASDAEARSLSIGNEAVTRLAGIDPARVEKLPPAPPKSPLGGLGGAPIAVQ